jgi:hypothetical protein
VQPGESASFTEDWWLAEMKYPEISEADLNALKAAMEQLK